MTDKIKETSESGFSKAGPGRKKGTTGALMKPKEWAEAEMLWETGNITLKELAERFGRVEETFSRYFARKGIKKGSKQAQHSEKVKEEVSKNIVDDAVVLATRIRETKEEHYKLSSSLVKLAFNEIRQAKADGQPYESKLNNLRALNTCMGIVKQGREERWAVLGLNDPDSINEAELPELLISEMTAAQIEEMQMRQVQSSDSFLDEIDNVIDDDEEEDNDVVEEGESV